MRSRARGDELGLDYSLHPVDPVLFRERIVPYAMGRGDISDLIERAIRVGVVRDRSSAWRQATFDLHEAMRTAQEKVGPKIKYKTEKQAPQSPADKQQGKPPQIIVEESEYPAPAPGMPGFDTDLTVWGRPFFNTAEGAVAGLAGHQLFMATVGKPAAEVDALCKKMLADLDTRRSRTPPDTTPAVTAAIAKAPPYVRAAKVDHKPSDTALWRKGYAAEWSMIRTIWDQRSAKEIDDAALARTARVKAGLPAEEDNGWVDVSDPSRPRLLPTGRELMAGLPLRLAGFAAALEPGWMGRGSAFTSSALRQIGVDPGDIFETPIRLFEEMVKAAPAGPWYFRDTIYDNFSLGGYVRPEKVPKLVQLLEANKDKLVRAWANDPPTAFDLENGPTDYLKNVEPAMYAASKGWGYLEAAEIYSGFLGWSN